MSRRVLLMNDDYVENSRVETLLKKVGFDVLSMQTEAGLGDKVLSFRPDMVVATGTSAKLAAISVGTKLKEMRGFSGAVILGIARGTKISPMDLLKVRMDRMLEAPFVVENLVRNMCEVLALDADACLEKLRKAQWSEGPADSQMVKGTGADMTSNEAITVPNRIKSGLTPQERRARFEKAVAGLDIDPAETTLKRSSARERWADVKKDWDLAKLEGQNELKKQFADALFEERDGEDDEEGA